jgi:hypothetical protein
LPHLTLKIDTKTFCYRYSTLHVHTIPHNGAREQYEVWPLAFNEPRRRRGTTSQGQGRGGPTQVEEGALISDSLAAASNVVKSRRPLHSGSSPSPRPWSALLIEAICEQSGYDGDDEDEQKNRKNCDIMFLDQETRVSLHVRLDNIVRTFCQNIQGQRWSNKVIKYTH